VCSIGAHFHSTLHRARLMCGCAAVIMVAIGIVYCLSGLGCQDDRPKAVHLKNGGGWADPDASGQRAPGGESSL
jgi:hypothetical protein